MSGCDICKRVHRGRCTPADQRSVNVTLTLPGRTNRRLRALVPWGTRSRWITTLVEAELDLIEDTIP